MLSVIMMRRRRDDAARARNDMRYMLVYRCASFHIRQRYAATSAVVSMLPMFTPSPPRRYATIRDA